MDDLKRRMSTIQTDKPMGTIEVLSGGWGRDERGVLFELTSEDELRAREERQRAKAQDFSGRKESFYLSAMKNLEIVIDALTVAQSGYLLVLACYMDYDGLLIRTQKRKEPMESADIAEALRLDTRGGTFRDFMEACLNHGIITQSERGYTVANAFHFRGKSAGIPVVKTYITQMKSVYDEVSAYDLGLIYRMIPFVHHETNMLCANPDEPYAKLIKKLTRKSLAEAIGVTPGVLSRKMTKVKFGDSYAFARITFQQNTFYMLNPEVFYRGKSAPDATTLAIFNNGIA